MVARPKLKDEHRAFLVRQLASYVGVTEAAKALKEHYGIEVSLTTVEHYNPASFKGKELSAKWRQLFDETRAAFVKKLEDIPIANKAVRLARMERACLAFESRGNYLGMLTVLERAAKEMGGSYTNRREYTGKKGGPIQFEEIETMTYEELQAEAARLEAKAKGITKTAGVD